MNRILKSRDEWTVGEVRKQRALTFPRRLVRMRTLCYEFSFMIARNSFSTGKHNGIQL